MEKQDEKEKKNIVFTVYNSMNGINIFSIAEFNKAIEVLKVRGIIKVSSITEYILKGIELNNIQDKISIVYDKKSNTLRVMDSEKISMLENFRSVDIEYITKILKKLVPSYELGINTNKPVFPVELQDGDNVIVKNLIRYNTYIYKNDQGFCESYEKQMYLMDMDMSKVVEVIRPKKINTKEYKWHIIYRKKKNLLGLYN